MSSHRARVLLLSKYYWPEPIGSAPYCTGLAEYLAGLGVAVEVLTCRPHYPTGRVAPAYADGGQDRQQRRGVAIRRLPPRPAGGGGALVRAAGDAVFLLQGLLALLTRRVGRADLVLSLCPSVLTVLLGCFAKRRGGRHVALVHDIESGLAAGLGMLGGDLPLRAMRGLERGLLNRCEVVLVLSEEMCRRLREIGVRAPVEVLPIWVDTERLRPVPSSTGGPFRLLYSGNFGRKQGLGQLVELAAALDRRRADVRIVLRGEGGQGQALRRQVAERGLCNVAFEPLLPPERLGEGLAEADLHLVPQHADVADYAVPSKVFAIMAVARPFIATARPGSQLWRLQQDSGGGLCVPPDRPEAFADAVIALAADRARCDEMGRKGRHHVVARFSRERVLADFSRLLGDLKGASWSKRTPAAS